MDEDVSKGVPSLASDKGPLVPGFVSKIVRCSVSDLVPHNHQLVVILSAAHMGMEKDATPVFARGIQR